MVHKVRRAAQGVHGTVPGVVPGVVSGAWCPGCSVRRRVQRTAQGAHGAVPGVVPGAWCAACEAQRGLRGVQHADLSLPLALSGGQEGKCCRSCCFHRRSGAPKPAQILISVGKQQQGLLSPWPAGDAFYFPKLYRSPQPLINQRK